MRILGWMMILVMALSLATAALADVERIVYTRDAFNQLSEEVRNSLYARRDVGEIELVIIDPEPEAPREEPAPAPVEEPKEEPAPAPVEEPKEEPAPAPVEEPKAEPETVEEVVEEVKEEAEKVEETVEEVQAEAAETVEEAVEEVKEEAEKVEEAVEEAKAEAAETVEEAVEEVKEETENVEETVEEVQAEAAETVEEAAELVDVELAEATQVFEIVDDEIVDENAENEATENAEGVVPAEGETPAEGEIPAEGEVAVTGETPVEGEVPAEGETIPAEEVPADETLTEVELMTIESLPENAELIGEILDELNAERSIDVYATYGDSIDFGDTITLIAVFNGYEGTSFDIQWQTNSGSGWEDVPGANGQSFSFTMNESNYTNDWRVLANIHEVAIPLEKLEEKGLIGE